jgi:hypothetical protein
VAQRIRAATKQVETNLSPRNVDVAAAAIYDTVVRGRKFLAKKDKNLRACNADLFSKVWSARKAWLIL